MDSILKLLSEYKISDIIILLCLLATSASGIYTAVKKVLSVFEAYRVTKNNVEDRDKYIHDTFAEINTKITEITDKLTSVNTEIDNIKEELVATKNNINNTNKVTSRSALYRLANELIIKQWMSQSEYETLQELSDIYLKSGATKYVIPALIQRALNLPVLTEEEIEAKAGTGKMF